MPAPRRARRRAGWASLLMVVGVVLLVIWAGSRYRARRSAIAARASLGDRALGDDDGARAGAGSHMAEVPDLVRQAHGNPGPLIAAFAAWAGDPSALPARRIVLGALAAESQPMARLAALLAAVQASPLAPGDDPLRHDVVAAVSRVWTRDTIRRGRDLIFAESRPKAREVVIASFVDLALSDRGAALDQDQRYALTSDFIDLYRQASPSQRRDIVAVVRRLGGDDTAELLQGNGFGASSPLDTHARFRRALEAVQRSAAGGSAP